jgi:hypothetical protein
LVQPKYKNKFNDKPWFDCNLEGELHHPYNNLKHTIKVKMGGEGEKGGFVAQ